MVTCWASRMKAGNATCMCVHGPGRVRLPVHEFWGIFVSLASPLFQLLFFLNGSVFQEVGRKRLVKIPLSGLLLNNTADTHAINTQGQAQKLPKILPFS